MHIMIRDCLLYYLIVFIDRIICWVEKDLSHWGRLLPAVLLNLPLFAASIQSYIEPKRNLRLVNPGP